MFSLLDRPGVRSAAQEAYEAPFLRFLQTVASSELTMRLRAIDAFERAARPIQDAFDWIRHISTKDPRVPATAKAFTEKAPNLAGDLRGRLQGACDGVRGTSSQADVESLARDFEAVVDGPSLFDTVLKRHQDVQRRKAAQGKRVWIERTSDGGGVVRSLYKVPEPPPDEDRHVHSYRTASVTSFLDDLRGPT